MQKYWKPAQAYDLGCIHIYTENLQFTFYFQSFKPKPGDQEMDDIES